MHFLFLFCYDVKCVLLISSIEQLRSGDCFVEVQIIQHFDFFAHVVMYHFGLVVCYVCLSKLCFKCFVLFVVFDHS